MLKPVQLLFLKLLRQFRTSEKIEQTAAPAPEEWGELLKLSVQHHVVPMIYEGVGRMPAFVSCPEAFKKEWKRCACSQVILQTRRTGAFLDLYREMTEEGLAPLVVKGLVCRELYAKPDFRISGDEDLLLPAGELQKMDAFLQSRGYERQGELNVYETTYRNRKTQVFLEVHTSLLPEEDASFAALNEEFRRVFEQKQKLEIDGYAVYTLNDTSHFFYLLCHSYKHFVHSGFGVRQLCDILMMAERSGKNMDWEEIIRKTKKYRMYVFWMNLMDIGERYLGFDWEGSHCPRPEDLALDSEALLLDMLEGGVYGSSSTGRVHSANITLGALERASRGEEGKLSLKSSLFPPKQYLKGEYPWLEKAGWLLPAAWILRLLRYGGKIWRKKRAGETQLNSISVGKQRVELLRKYGILGKDGR